MRSAHRAWREPALGSILERIDFLTPVMVAALLAALLPLRAPLVAANVIHVPGDRPTIQSGIDAASPGDTVLVACGVYHEHDIVMRSGITLESESGTPDCANIDAQDQGRVMVCESTDTTATIAGFTLRRGSLPACNAGGGVYCLHASPRFRDCTFADNEECNGGGVYCLHASPHFSACTFEDNSASYKGGALYCSSSAPVFADCRFSGNTAADAGGAIYCGDASPSLAECTFEDNWASSGGAPFCSVVSHPVAWSCLVACNAAFHCGGGIACESQSSLELTGCVFAHNTVQRDGGALSSSAAWLHVDGCTFWENSAGLAGAGLFLANGSVALVDRTIIAGAPDGEAVWCEGAGSAATASCCDVFGNAGGNWVSCLVGQCGLDGNFEADALFCDPAAGDLSLHSNSPCAPGHAPPAAD